MISADQLRSQLQESVDAVRQKNSSTPDVAIVLGTGLGALAREIVVENAVPYKDIPHFPLSTVESHTGQLLIGKLAGRRVVAMEGRFHLYEGYSASQIAHAVRVLHGLGARTLVVSNACGVMNTDWRAGDVMIMTDHINLLGDNPLIGPNLDELGPRFPDMSDAYDPELRRLASSVGRREGIELREGVYVAVAGPNLETPAEYRMLRFLGADVVGMSTVPEVIVARQMGMRVLGISIITDECFPDHLEPASIEKIIATARGAEPKLTTIVKGVIESL
ncbi:MAG TPA: purine-nucleoside phosphorylase [Longimicrobiales bacterium]|nr:purine-nucleoside phosphorylase [Longimicrobiales bacterium]